MPDALASTASRPAFVTTRDRPSDRNETVMDIEVIWVRPEQKYFCKRGWTDHFGKHEVICPSGKINGHVGWVEPFAKPITVQKVMGIASLHPSYASADLPAEAR